MNNYTYPALKNSTYLNTSGCGLIPTELLAESNAFQIDFVEKGSLAFEDWMMNSKPRIKDCIASFMGASPEEVAMIPNFSMGMAMLMPILEEYKKVVLFKDDYPSLRDPFVLNDFEISWISSPGGFQIQEEDIKVKLKESGSKLLVISHVHFLSGFTLDIQSIGSFCKENGITFIVDATQSAGRVPLNFFSLNVDALIWSNYKWMNGGFGTGIMLMKKEFMASHPPKVAGYGSYKMEGDRFYYEPSMASYEPNHQNALGFNLLELSISQKNDLGFENVVSKGNQLLRATINGLQEIGRKISGPPSMDNRAGIVCFQGTAEEQASLRAKNIILTYRNGHFRAGPHFYNTEEDIQKLLNALKEV